MTIPDVKIDFAALYSDGTGMLRVVVNDFDVERLSQTGWRLGAIIPYEEDKQAYTGGGYVTTKVLSTKYIMKLDADSSLLQTKQEVERLTASLTEAVGLRVSADKALLEVQTEKDELGKSFEVLKIKVEEAVRSRDTAESRVAMLEHDLNKLREALGSIRYDEILIGPMQVPKMATRRMDVVGAELDD